MDCKKCQKLFEVICDVNINAVDILRLHESLAERLAYIVKLTDDCISNNPKIMKEGNDAFDKPESEPETFCLTCEDYKKMTSMEMPIGQGHCGRCHMDYTLSGGFPHKCADLIEHKMISLDEKTKTALDKLAESIDTQKGNEDDE